MTRDQEMQKLIRHYREESGKSECDMHAVAEWAARKGFRLPTPPTPLEILAKQFSRAARSETRIDAETGQEYRVNHAFKDDTGQLTLWVDIDVAQRKHMQKSVTNRREQVVGDLLQLTFDIEYWNRKNPTEFPLSVPLDFGPDIDWRKNGGDAASDAA